MVPPAAALPNALAVLRLEVALQPIRLRRPIARSSTGAYPRRRRLERVPLIVVHWLGGARFRGRGDELSHLCLELLLLPPLFFGRRGSARRFFRRRAERGRLGFARARALARLLLLLSRELPQLLLVQHGLEHSLTGQQQRSAKGIHSNGTEPYRRWSVSLACASSVSCDARSTPMNSTSLHARPSWRRVRSLVSKWKSMKCQQATHCANLMSKQAMPRASKPSQE